MAIRYHHTQHSMLMPAILLVEGLAFAATGDFDTLSAWRSTAWTVAILFVILAWLFSSLTVEVDEKELRWHFGPGLWAYRIARAEVESVAAVRNHWLNGFGIRMRPGYRLYNVSGLDAVELRLKSGGVRRIGTDDPEALANALRS